MRTVVWVVALATVGLVFDGYDLVVYGAVVSTFLRDPSQIGNVSPAIAGMLGSYALVGVLVGALPTTTSKLPTATLSSPSSTSFPPWALMRTGR
jgi:hypothetical protein